MAATLGQRKAAHLADTKPNVVATTNPGCIIQLQAAARATGRPLRVLHVMEILDAAISGHGAGEFGIKNQE